MEKNYKFLNLCSVSTETFLAIWSSQYKFLINEVLIKKCVFDRLTSYVYHKSQFRVFFLLPSKDREGSLLSLECLRFTIMYQKRVKDFYSITKTHSDNYKTMQVISSE